MKLIGWRQSLLGVASLLAWGASSSCASQVNVVTGGGTTSTTSTSAGGAGGTGGAGGAGGTIGFGGYGGYGGTIPGTACGLGDCQDFPASPILGDAAVPPNAATLFGPPGNYTAPTAATPLCVLEPQLGSGTTAGAMIPSNWAEPRFRIKAAGLNLFEIRITSPWEKDALVAYTTQPEWYMPRAIWFGLQPPSAAHPSGTGLSNNASAAPLTVTIRGIDTTMVGMTPVGVTGELNIAPVAVTGNVVFYATGSEQIMPGSSQLLGFEMGDEGVRIALSLGQLGWAGQPGEDGAELRGYYPAFPAGQVQCMGCHTGTPDGSAVVFTDSNPWLKGAAWLSQLTGAVPAGFGGTGTASAATIVFGAGAQSMFKTPWWGAQSMSAAHWTPGDAILVSSYGTSFQGAPPSFATGSQRTMVWEALPHYDTTNPLLDDAVNHHALAWIDMESTATIDVAFPSVPDYGATLTTREMEAAAAEGSTWGLIATGDTMSDVMPSMSNLAATDTIAYVESDFTPDGHPDYTATMASIRTVPYNRHMGGTSQPLAGASDPGHLNYYPTYSADDALIAFVQAPAPSAASPDGPYYNRHGQVMIVPAGGGTPIRLSANDPNACAGDDLSQGIINSWPVWSPAVAQANGKTYYFLLFTSARAYGDEFSEPFMMAADPQSRFTGLRLSSQLYLTAVVVDDTTNEVTTYPAVYVWNQNRTPGASTGNAPLSNLTPQWGNFALPPLIIPPHP